MSGEMNRLVMTQRKQTEEFDSFSSVGTSHVASSARPVTAVAAAAKAAAPSILDREIARVRGVRRAQGVADGQCYRAAVQIQRLAILHA